MKPAIYYTVIACFFSMIFGACKPKINLGDVDLTTQVETSLSLPLGTISLKLGDFLGDSTIQGVSVDETGQYVFSDTMHFDHSINMIDINKYLSPGHYKLDLAEEISQVYPEFTNAEIPAGQTLKLDFPIHISTHKLKADAENQRFLNA